MEKDMLRLWLLGQGLTAEAAEVVLGKAEDAFDAVNDFVTSITHEAKAKEAAAVLAAAEAAKRLGKDALAAAFLEHAEHLVFGGDEEEQEQPSGAPTPG